MILYRFSPKQFSSNISGEGARMHGGRWNSKGIAALYTSLNISLALLELLIHSTSHEEISNNQLTVIETTENNFDEIHISRLKHNWETDDDYCKFIGDEFLKAKNTLLLKVPSAIISEEANIIINPTHKNFNKIKIAAIKPFHFDIRLFKHQS